MSDCFFYIWFHFYIYLPYNRCALITGLAVEELSCSPWMGFASGLPCQFLEGSCIRIPLGFDLGTLATSWLSSRMLNICQNHGMKRAPGLLPASCVMQGRKGRVGFFKSTYGTWCTWGWRRILSVQLCASYNPLWTGLVLILVSSKCRDSTLTGAKPTEKLDTYQNWQRTHLVDVGNAMSPMAVGTKQPLVLLWCSSLSTYADCTMSNVKGMSAYALWCPVFF